MRLHWLSGLVAVVLVVGCGGGSGGGGGSDEAQIRQVIGDFVEAFNDGNARDLRELMDESSRNSCDVQELQMLLQLVNSFTGDDEFALQVESVSVNGNTASVQVKPRLGDEEQSSDTQEMVKEGGKWKLALGDEGCGI